MWQISVSYCQKKPQKKLLLNLKLNITFEGSTLPFYLPVKENVARLSHLGRLLSLPPFTKTTWIIQGVVNLSSLLTAPSLLCFQKALFVELRRAHLTAFQQPSLLDSSCTRPPHRWCCGRESGVSNITNQKNEGFENQFFFQAGIPQH